MSSTGSRPASPDSTAKRLPVLLAPPYEYRGRCDEAIALYRKILQQDKQNVQALNNLAYLLAWRDGKNAEARELIQTALNLAGPNPELLDSRAVISFRNDQPELAIRICKRLSWSAPSATRYFHLALAQQLAKNQTAARKAFSGRRGTWDSRRPTCIRWNNPHGNNYRTS